jgi:hypothetical protein
VIRSSWFAGCLNLGFRTPDDLQQFVADVVPLLRELAAADV